MVTSFKGEYDNTMADLLTRRETAFVLWHLTRTEPPPRLIIGWIQPGTPLQLVGEQSLALRPVPGFDDLWELPASECGLIDGWVYYYWFEVTSSRPGRPVDGAQARIQITDPFATAVDWRLLGRTLPPPFTGDDRYPASAVKYSAGRLVSADVGGEQPSFTGTPLPDSLPPNNRLVIYELPTAWAHSGAADGLNVGVGTFRDIIALIDATASGASFSELEVSRFGRAYLSAELGVNALQLPPVADGACHRAGDHATSHFFAPDFELGFPTTYSWPAPNRDMADLSRTCHAHGMRFIAGLMFAVSKCNPYLDAAYEEFFLDDGTGVNTFRTEHFAAAYDPVSGATDLVSPARQFMKTAIDRWVQDFHIDGLRLDGVESVASEEIVRVLTDHARLRNSERYAALGLSAQADARFIVVGDGPGEPTNLLERHKLDGLWHSAFKDYIRMALVGRPHENEPGFESTVRRALDCRSFGYTDLSQAVIYLTSHQVAGYRNERLFDFFTHNGVTDAEKRTKLAFACLLTAVGVPMILAGEEFADQHDAFDRHGNVTQSSVNFARLGHGWRERLKTYVSRLVKLRTSYDALAANEIEVIHTDFADGKRVIVWRRGVAGSESQVIVVANFSDYGTPDVDQPHAEYVVPGWPETPPNRRWREVPQDRWVDEARAGKEPLFSWEAKVYALF
ncbi:MAG: alpha amylase [Gammaproteobacteria bacterium]